MAKIMLTKLSIENTLDPFAGTILQEDVHEWFDLRGMEDSPHMMYAVNCLRRNSRENSKYYTCRWNLSYTNCDNEQNKHYYDPIKVSQRKTGIPIISQY